MISNMITQTNKKNYDFGNSNGRNIIIYLKASDASKGAVYPKQAAVYWQKNEDRTAIILGNGSRYFIAQP